MNIKNYNAKGFIKKEEFKAKLAGRPIDFGFIKDREEFFEWCIHNSYMGFIKYHKQKNADSFFVYRVLKSLMFEMEHIRYKEFPDWTSKIKSDPGNMLVDSGYHVICNRVAPPYEKQ